MNEIWQKFMRGGVIVGCLFLSSLSCGCSEEDAPQIGVSQSLIQVKCSATSTPVFVTSNEPWEAIVVDPDAPASTVFSQTNASTPAWCRLSKSSGKESMSINVVIDDWHELATHRNAVIRFRTLGDDPSYATILVEQQSEDAWNE